MIFFFFSSRRRHTRCSRDWSSDVCSSDLNSPRDVVEGIAELGPFRHVRLAKPRQIGRNHMKSVGELRNEIAEHVACGWKAVQQKECRSVRATALPVENFDAVDGYSPVIDLSHLSTLRRD